MKWFKKKKGKQVEEKEPEQIITETEPDDIEAADAEAVEPSDDAKPKKGMGWFKRKKDKPVEDKIEDEITDTAAEPDDIEQEAVSEVSGEADVEASEDDAKPKKGMRWFKRKKDKSSEDEITDAETDAAADSEQEAVSEASELPDKEPPADSKIHAKHGNEKSKTGIVSSLRKGLSKTRQILTTDIDELFTRSRNVEDILDEVEERLITSDIGVQVTMKLMERISKKASKISDANQLKDILKTEILSFVNIEPPAPETYHKPHVIMVVGINGVGKTTTIGKLAAKFTDEGKKVLIAAADTFRAAAGEQLTIWAERAGAEIVKHRDNADPAAVAYDSVEAAVARNKDIVLIDTAGRLHTKVNLMEELKKINRVISKKIPDAPHEVLLVLDATTGQNALSQTKLFNDTIGVTGIALAKLDGTAKGGIVVNICSTFNIPLKYIGIGESIEDLQEFDPEKFADALF